MNGNNIFLDTNILLYFLKGEQEIIQMLSSKQIVVSFITELELLSFAHLIPDSEKIIKGLLSSCTIEDVNHSIKKNTIQIMKDYKIKLPDAIIAATAMPLNLPIVTAYKQFGRIDLLEVVLYEF